MPTKKHQGPGYGLSLPDEWYEVYLEKQGLRRCQDCKLVFTPAKNLEKQFSCEKCRAKTWAEYVKIHGLPSNLKE